MNMNLRTAAVLLLTAVSAAAQVQPDAVLLRSPDVSRDAIVFRYANDLWLVDKSGGVAQPLSSPPGPEANPKFSPDGARIAFVGGYDGGSDLYVLDLVGGVPRRVTHHPGEEELCDWQPDGKALIFSSNMRSGQARAERLFRVSPDGGEAEPLPVPYGAWGAIDDTGSWLAYTPDANEFRNWKRYQGGLAQDIWLFNLVTFESRRVTDHPGSDVTPMWRGHELYFSSDRGPKGRMNLWLYDVQRKSTEQLTDFGDADVRAPSIGPEDLVFECGGKLWRHELATRATAPVEVVIPGDRPKLTPRTLSVAGNVASLASGPALARVVVEARGELFSTPVGEGVVRNLSNSDGVAERSPAWSPDGAWIAYFSDRSGEYELCVRRADGSDAAERQLTHLGQGWREYTSWAPDSRSLVFGTSAGELWHVALEAGEPRRIAADPDGNAPRAAWSPDSRWLAWSMRSDASRLAAVFVHDLESGQTQRITSARFDDSQPCFDRKGEWLHLVSQRNFAAIGSEFDDSFVFANSRVLCGIALRRDVANPLLVSDPREGEKQDGAQDESKPEKAQDEPKEGAPEGEKEAAAPKPVNIDFDGIESRLVIWPVEPGQLGSLWAGEGVVYYLRGGALGSDEPVGALVRFEFGAQPDERKEQTVLAGVSAYELSADGKKVLAQVGEKWFVVNAAADQKAEKALDLSGLTLSVDPRREWAQVLADVRRQYRAYFYDATMHGLDWDAVCARYAAALADVSTRDDLHLLITELLGELNCGHAYNFGGPDVPERPAKGERAGLVGADWRLEAGAFRIARILGAGSPDAEARGPLAQPGVDARPGDVLLEVNGVAPDVTRDVYAAFLGRIGRPTELLLNQVALKDGNERRVVVVPLESESELRYRDWVETNRRSVDELSGGKVAYVHVPNTAGEGRRELVRQLAAQYHKDALIVDERWNGGGWLPNRLIELLDRPRTNFWALRSGEDWVTPSFAHHGPKCMLINGAAGSGGDMFPYLFRQAALGPLIGRRTWGGLVGIGGMPPLVDGSSISVPGFAFYELDGTWGVEGFGVAPDLEVIDDPALMVHGEDPQLAAAVAEMLRQIEAFGFKRPARPAAPDRRGSGVTPQDR